MIHIRAMTEAGLPEAARLIRVAFGTFLGAPDPATAGRRSTIGDRKNT